MARALRIQFAGVYYHVAGRGNEGRGGLDYSSVSLNRKKFVAALDHDEDLRKPYSRALEMLNIQD